jgi:hypothetical protein
MHDVFHMRVQKFLTLNSLGHDDSTQEMLKKTLEAITLLSP